MSLLGPLARWELVRLGRGGSLPRVRAGLVLALLGGLAIAYYGAIDGPGASVTIAQASRVAQNYLYAYLAVQALAVVVLTPVIAAGAIADEKERGRLDFLRSTELSATDIVLGKYFTRVLHLFAILAAGVPVLALATLFGGVDVDLLIAGTLTTVTGVLWVAAYGLWLGVKRANLREASLVAYLNLTGLTVAGLVCGCLPGVSGLSPLSAAVYLVAFRETPAFLPNVAVIAGLQLCLTLTFLGASIKDFAGLVGDEPIRIGPFTRDLTAPVPPQPLDIPRPPIPVDDGDPLGWKERHFAPKYAAGVNESMRGCLIGIAATALSVVAAFAFAQLMWSLNLGRPERMSRSEGFPDFTRALASLISGLVMVLFATRTATSVAGEAERQTLTPLLVLPLDRADILRAKLRAGLGWLGATMGATLLVELTALPAFVDINGPVAVAGAALVLAQVASTCLLAATLGLWLSVSCATATRAAIWSVAVLLTLAVVPLLLTPLAPTPFASAAVAAISPPAGVWLSHVNSSVGVLALATQLLAAWLLWRSARRRFEDLGR